MPESRSPVLTGGCQCGAVRYALYARPEEPDICHCRMCQKAFGAYFAAFGGVALADFAWTRGRPGVFASSAAAERGFCQACGTPLSIRYVDGGRIAVALGSLDDPAAVKPVRAYGVESIVPFFAELAALPGTRSEEALPAEDAARRTPRQHPDHDTDDWPPRR